MTPPTTQSAFHTAALLGLPESVIRLPFDDLQVESAALALPFLFVACAQTAVFATMRKHDACRGVQASDLIP